MSLDLTFLNNVTREHFAPGLQNQLYDEMPLMKKIISNGIETATGRSLIWDVPLYRSIANGQISGYDPMITQDQNLIAQAALNYANYYYSNVSISLEEEDMNTGSKERLINMLDAKHQASKMELKEKVYKDIFLSVTTRGGYNTLVGMKAAIETDNTYAGIDRSIANNAGWRANANDTAATDAELTNPASGVRYFPTVIRNLALNAAHDKNPSMIILTKVLYELLQFLGETVNLRFQGSNWDFAADKLTMGKQGAQRGQDVFWDNYCTSLHMFLVTPEDWKAFIFPGRNFEPAEVAGQVWRSGQGQLATYMTYLWKGQVLCTCPRQQAVATALGG